MSSIENVRLGDCIMPTAYKYRAEKIIPPAWEGEYQPAISPLTTQPLLVVSIDAPFILCEQLVTRVGEAHILDARYCDWTKVSKRFVREYCRMHKLAVPKPFATRETADKEREANKGHCPKCGETMTERMGADKAWLLTCKECQMQFVPMSSVKA